METLPKFAKVVLVTGAVSGIGRATSLKLAKERAILALSEINPSALAETLSLCKGALHTLRHSDEHIAMAFDVDSSERSNAFVAAATARLSRIAHVFNCAEPEPLAACDGRRRGLVLGPAGHSEQLRGLLRDGLSGSASAGAGAAAVWGSGEQVSLGRAGTPEEVTEVAGFGMGEESRYVNGSVGS